MKQNRKKYVQSIEDPQDNHQLLYDPFSRHTSNLSHMNKNPPPRQEYKCCVTLFEDDDEAHSGNEAQGPTAQDGKLQIQVELHVMKQINGIYNKSAPPPKTKEEVAKPQQPKDSILSKIIANKTTQKKAQLIAPKQNYVQQQCFGFNTNFRVAYPQTPGFKSLLHSPFGKFNSLFKETIITLAKQNEGDNKYNITEAVDLLANPLLFHNKSKVAFEAAKYFIGIAIKLKQMNAQVESLYFCCLACYADPFNSQTWRKYAGQLEEQGKLSRACVIAKTGFLFTQNEELMKSFLSNGQKCGLDVGKIQGIMCSISNPEAFEKTLLPQSAKLQIKNSKSWKGVKMLWQICRSNDYKLSVCINTLFLARYLENIGYLDKGMSILRQSFSKSMSKLEIYLQYLQMSIRKNNNLLESELQDVLKYLECISGENRYKLLLQIAQLLYKKNDQRFYNFIASAYKAAVDYCAQGAGCSKALKQIYYTVAKLKKVAPRAKNTIGDHIVFEMNRRKFVNGEALIQHQFEDWKYYLHYGVIKRSDLLGEAAKKFPLTGRIIAQWIHCLRLTKRPLQILKFWRDKIDEVPKSGELWCEGGRIYAELGQYANAEKCFRCAMHFTPQYGDSFIEELRLLLKDSRFLEVEKLRKLFLVCEPFYGHVLSFLKLNHWHPHMPSLNEVWQNAVYQISQDLYRSNPQTQKRQLTAYIPYNIAYAGQGSPEEREKLFVSYQQMENKN